MSPDPALAITPHMSYAQMRHYADVEGIAVESEANLGHDLWGMYDDSSRMILIERKATYRQKRCALCHELVHWRYGDSFRDHVLKAKAECRTRRMTAKLLIDPQEYKQLEIVYDGDRARIADDLDVTQQVLTDYQSFLVENPGLKNLCSTH
jgi:hypothetical protein